MESSANDIGLRTQYCLDQIKNRSNNESAKVIIIFGRRGVGRSTLMEHLTGAKGHACDERGPGTTAFQLEEFIINGEEFFVMDTPGFDAGDEAEVFFEIARGIEAIRRHATIVGVLFVASVSYFRIENLDRKLLGFLELFCGDEYIPRITFVTTHWTHASAAQSNRFAQLRSLWLSFLARGAGLYQHGRKYNDQHEDTGICLPWESNRDRIAEYARSMVSRHYGGVNGPVVRILTELDRGNGVHLTSAAKFFRAPPRTYNEPEDRQSRENTAQDEPPRRPEPQGTERAQNHLPPAGTDAINSAWNSLVESACKIGAGIVDNIVKSQLSGLGTSGPSSRRGGFSPDPNSLVDTCKLLGIPADLGSRMALGARYNSFNVGTEDGNDALNKILKGWL